VYATAVHQLPAAHCQLPGARVEGPSDSQVAEKVRKAARRESRFKFPAQGPVRMRLVLRGSVVSLVGVVVGARVAAMLPRVRFRLPCPRAGWLQLASAGSTCTQQAPGTGWSFSSWPWLQLQDAFVLAFSVKRICSFAPARTHDNGV